MSFNDHLAFNISKSTPTTSTTNANTTSAPPSASASSNEIPNSSSIGSSNSKSPFLQNILTRTSTALDSSSPKFGPVGSLAGSSVAPTVLTVGDRPKTKSNNRNGINNKTDLIGLFDKFNISNRQSQGQSIDLEATDDEKFDNYGSLESEEGVNDTEKFDDSGTSNSKEEVSDQDREGVLKHLDDINIPNTSPTFVVKEEKTSLMTVQACEPLTNIAISQKMETSSSGNLSNSSSYTNEPFLINEKDTRTESEKDDRIENDKDLSNINENFEDQEIEPEEYQLKEQEPEMPGRELEHEPDNKQTMSSDRHRESISQITRKTQQNVNPKEQYQQSHKPFYFQNFLSQLRKKTADPIVRYIRSFLVSFTRQGYTFTAEQKIKIIIDFKNFMNEKFSLYEPFASMDAIDLENSREGLEKLIMNRLYDHCFPPEFAKQSNNYLPESFKKDLEDDEGFAKQLEKFSWINVAHLDIDLQNLSKLNKDGLSFIDSAITELNKINKYRAPRDKIICILNSCKIIFSFLRISNRITNADSFIPILILIIIKAKTDHLISNMRYIENYRGEEWLSHGETSYYLSSLQGAIGFIQNISFEDLTINEDEYNAHIEAWQAEEKQRSLTKEEHQSNILQPSPQRRNNSFVQPNQIQQSLSPSNVLLTSAEIFTKSITNFLSSSPQEQSGQELPPINSQIIDTQPSPPPINAADQAQMKQTYKSLREVFPNLDKAVLKDIIFMNQGNVEECIDACLQLVNDV